jgi:hypothetical protein
MVDVAAYDYNDRVRIRSTGTDDARVDAVAWIVGIFLKRPAGPYFAAFPPGVVYTIEYEDGSSQEVHEADLERWPGD